MLILADMNARSLKIVVISGSLAILCIVVVQLKFMWQSLNQEQREFNQSVQLALLDVVRQINNNPNLGSIANPVRQLSDDYFIVDINQNINAGVLEIYLVEIFAKYRIDNDFEYAIYNCENDQMVYGNYMSGGNVKPAKNSTVAFDKSPDLIYYFGVHFPAIQWQLARSLSLWIILVVVSVIVVAFFGYTVFVIWRQKRLSEMQRDFINNITHEFKTPLSSLALSANYLINRPEFDKRTHNYADIIRQQTNLLTNKVEQILQVASLEKRNYENEQTNVNLPDLIYSIIDFEKSRNPGVSMELKSELLSVEANLNLAHLETVMLNLLDNAIKYGGPNPLVETTLSRKNNVFCISISDNGIGIPKKQLKNVFKKFYRVPGTGQQKGFGLGLYQVQQICKKNRWQIKLKSEIRRGTTCILKIPARHG